MLLPGELYQCLHPLLAIVAYFLLMHYIWFDICGGEDDVLKVERAHAAQTYLLQAEIFLVYFEQSTVFGL